MAVTAHPHSEPRLKKDGGRKAGRTKLWCLDCVENDLKSMGVKRHSEGRSG
jgi:hypothetical protein